MRTGELARLTSVSLRTLRFYDRIGLLTPSARTDAGYRLYDDKDLVRLQQILALKLLGFSLDEIKRFLQASPGGLLEVLAQQRAMLQERRDQLDDVIAATERAEQAIISGTNDWNEIFTVIRVTQMNQETDWRTKYFTPEQLEAMGKIGEGAYSAEAQAALAARGPWTEEDQKRVDAQYAALYAGVRQAAAAGEDPAGPAGQALASQAIGLIEAFTGGNAAVASGLENWWTSYQAVPKDERPFQIPLTDEESGWLERAKAIYAAGRR